MARVRRLVRIISGFALILVGIVGLFLPVLQGIAMIIAGLLLLAPDFPWARRIVQWMRKRWGEVRGSKPRPEP